MGEVIGILSLKGGVGKTSVSIELASTLRKFGKKVLVIDGNFSAPNIGLHFNFEPEKSIHHVLSGKNEIEEAIYVTEYFDVIFASMNFKFKIDPMKLKQHLKKIRDFYDYIVIDSSPALNEETLGVMTAADKLFVVTTPDHTTLLTSLKAIESAKKKGVKIEGVFLNRVHNRKFEIPLRDVEKISSVPVIAVVPYDIGVLEALARFIPYTYFSPKSEGAEEYRKVAASLIGFDYKPPRFKGFFKWKTPFKQDLNRMILAHKFKK